MIDINATGPAGTDEKDRSMASNMADANATSNSAVAIDWPIGAQQQGTVGPSLEASGPELGSGDQRLSANQASCLLSACCDLENTPDSLMLSAGMVL